MRQSGHGALLGAFAELPDQGPILDTAKIRMLRLSLGVSQRRVASSLGVSSPTVMRLEEGRGHGEMALKRVVSLAESLGVTPGELFADTREPVPEAAPDDIKIEAALVASRAMVRTDELADALGWPLSRTTQALNRLRRRLSATGLRLHRTTNGWRIMPGPVLETAERQALETTRNARRGLSLSQVQLLLAVIAGLVDARWEQRASNAERVTLSSLLRAGYVERQGHRYTASTAVIRSLPRLGETADALFQQAA